MSRRKGSRLEHAGTSVTCAVQMGEFRSIMVYRKVAKGLRRSTIRWRLCLKTRLHVKKEIRGFGSIDCYRRLRDDSEL